MTIKTALWELQKAVVARLESDPILTNMVTGIFDEVEPGTKLPYVQIGDDTVNPYDTKTTTGEDLTLTLHVWSAGPGKNQAKQIMNVVLQAMSAAPLTLEGFKVDGMKREFLEVFNDGRVYHGVCRFRFYTIQIN